MIKNLYVSSEYKFINKRSVHSLIASLKHEIDFSITSLYINFITGKEIHEINNKYLKHNYTTDIITFNYNEDHKNFDGEIFISVDDARLNAEKYKVDLNNELIRLVIHGILHLAGFDDRKKKDKIIMKRHENNLLNSNKFVLLIGQTKH